MPRDSDAKTSFDAAQNDPGFLSWLAMMEFQLEEFFTFDLPPELPDDPFTDEGMDFVQEWMLGRFAKPSELVHEDGKVIFDRCTRFVGECFVRRVGGRWVFSPGAQGTMSYVGVANPGSEMPIIPHTQITSSIGRRLHGSWSRAVKFAEEDAGLRPSTRIFRPGTSR